MIKAALTTLLSFALTAAHGQSNYTVDCPKQDSCFLVEISPGQIVKGEPRPSVTINYRFFRSKEEFDAIVNAIKEQANKEISNGVDRNRFMLDVADRIKAAWPPK
mgnify:FL=1